ncbi:MAG: hypothetical protein AB1779_07050 [Candidatus Thermoplasmatota archaeon]
MTKKDKNKGTLWKKFLSIFTVVLLSAVVFNGGIGISANDSIIGNANGASISEEQLFPFPPLFVPDKFVPLSQFVVRGSEREGTLLLLSVKPEILRYLVKNNQRIEVAYYSSQGAPIKYLPPTSINIDKGMVYLYTSLVGVFTIVSSAFFNDFPIVTHWDQSLRNGRGGPRIGASDALGIIDIDLKNGHIKVQSYIYDENPKSPYTYATDKYALFKDPTARVPSYERYIGEDYAIYKITDLFAIWVSEQMRQRTGYPVLHRNYPWAFDSLAPQAKKIQSSVPLWQVVHAYLIATAPDKGSLATFLLPPYWKQNPLGKYPILFNGQYDIHYSGFIPHGGTFMKIIGDLIKQGYGGTIGILWNGGGALGARTFQRSAYDNADLLFREAERLLGADPHKIVMLGGSRGGVTALGMAANPYHENYTVEYALAYVPGVKIGEHIADFINPTYPALLGGLDQDTGYKYAWRQGWRDPESNLTANQLIMFNLLGTTDPQKADNLSAFSDMQINALKRKGTKVLLSVGTHDVFMPFSLYLKYVDKLRAFNVTLKFEIGYRFGHSGATSSSEYAKVALQKVLTGDTTFETGTYHYKRKSESEWWISIPFSPLHQPIFLEAPKAMAWGEKVSITIVGGAGMHYHLKTWKIDNALWQKEKKINKTGLVCELKNVFPDRASPIQYAVRHIHIPNKLQTGYYLYELFYSIDNGTTWIQVPPECVSQVSGYKQPVFLVVAKEPMISGNTVYGILGWNGRGWGLSSEMIVPT